MTLVNFAAVAEWTLSIVFPSLFMLGGLDYLRKKKKARIVSILYCLLIFCLLISIFVKGWFAVGGTDLGYLIEDPSQNAVFLLIFSCVFVYGLAIVSSILAKIASHTQEGDME